MLPEPAILMQYARLKPTQGSDYFRSITSLSCQFQLPGTGRDEEQDSFKTLRGSAVLSHSGHLPFPDFPSVLFKSIPSQRTLYLQGTAARKGSGPSRESPPLCELPCEGSSAAAGQQLHGHLLHKESKQAPGRGKERELELQPGRGTAVCLRKERGFAGAMAGSTQQNCFSFCTASLRNGASLLFERFTLGMPRQSLEGKTPSSRLVPP